MRARKKIFSLCSALAILTLLLPLHVRSEQAEAILLRNITLPDKQADNGGLRVNILIRNSTLELITRDHIAVDQVDRAFDGAGGIVLGNLTLGETASFLILDGDPRQKLAVILDTKSHLIFAIDNGKIIENRLAIIPGETSHGKERESPGWLAYSPPPLAVPLDYQDKTRWNRFDTEYISGLFSAAVVLDRMNWTGQNRSSEIAVGDLTDYEGGEIRAFRFGGVGTLNFSMPLVWTLAGATHAFDRGFDSTEDDDYTLYDARIDIPVLETASISIGKQKEPISMERIMAMTDMPMQERAAVSDALLPARNVGVVMSGSLFDERATLAGGLFNNWLDKDQPDSPGDNATQFVGRATWIPFLSSNGSSILHLGAGYRTSNAREGFVTAAEPEFKSAPDFISTSFIDADQLDTYQLEASFRSGPYWLHSEYLRTEIDGSGLGDLVLDGYHLTASWIFSGEMRPYNRRVGVFGGIPISRSVDQNGWGAWEASARFSSLDMTDFPLEGGDMDIWSAGLTWLLSPYLNVFFNYRYITVDQLGDESTSHGFNTRIMMVLE